MERRITDPEELADLFRVDHMTTRMRRHAEGLLIVAGGSSGRPWREPVPIVDVMRAAAAEVEDYPRIKVVSRTSSAAVPGHAVADIIHLLAELVENAATFSPANTKVLVEGAKLAGGIVVQIEDRGLGMSEEQLCAINETLADPPLFDLSGSDQLGLFIAGQLGKRHDVRITLQPSAHGGITAVVLIPGELIVDVDDPDADPAIAGIRALGRRPVPEFARTTIPAPAATPVALAGGGQLTWAQYAGPVKEPAPAPAELDGLPVRVRQASLASQLRAPAVAVAEASPPAGVPSPDAARSTMAALQLGWQRGRSAAHPDGQDEPAGQDRPRRGNEPQEAPEEGGAS
jgi:anti-sigma regulatory factor (Ser/Thr protein kinase)